MLQTKALGVLLIGLVILGGFSVFTVDERQRVIKFQLGRIVRADYMPGLHFKAPFVQNVLKFDGRVQNLDSDPELFLTSEKKNVIVDAFVKWRIQDVKRYFTSTGGNVQLAGDRLSTVIQKRLKDEFGKRTVNEVVSGERAEIIRLLTASAKDQAAGLGIGIVDVRIKRIDLPEEVSSSVFQRMSAEREEVAQDFRSRGEEAAKIIRAKANREREVIIAEAERDAERTRGSGDAKATGIYASSFSQDPEFYGFYRSLNAYQESFQERTDVLLLQPDSKFFTYFKNPDVQP